MKPNKRAAWMAAMAMVLLLCQCSKNKDGKVELKIRAIDTVNLDGRWAGYVYTADNRTLGSFTVDMSESLDGAVPTLTKLSGSMKTPPLCKELENEGHTSVPTAAMSGSRDVFLHYVLVRTTFTTTLFRNGNVWPGTPVSWEFSLDSLWVDGRGNQLSENAVLEGVATTSTNCNTQGYRVKITKLP